MSEPFEWLSLDADEEIVWSGRPRIQVLLYLVVPALVVPAVILLAWPTPGGAVAGVLAWLAIASLGYAYVRNVSYVVSTKYAYAKRGVLGRSVTQIGLHNIQDTTLTQGILGTQFGYGTVAFSTAGGEGVTLGFHVIDGPGGVKRTIDRQISSVHDEPGPDRDARDRGDVEALVSAVAGMRSAAESVDRALERRGDRR